MQYLRAIAGVFMGAGALMLLWKGEYTAGVGLLGMMGGFFIGEANGKKEAQTEETD